MDPAVSEVSGDTSYMTITYPGSEEAFRRIIITEEQTSSPLLPSDTVVYETKIETP